MSAETAATVLAGLVFVAVGYVLYFKHKNGRWPKLRSPFE